MKKILLGSISGLTIAMFGLGISAHADTINDGTNTGDVKINGAIGADNTDENTPIPDGSDDWINVTLDTATIFYNTNVNTNITSPAYDIKNNSGRPVDVKVNGFKQDDALSIKDISGLAVKFTRMETATNPAISNTTPLIKDGAILTDYTGATTLTLANSKGKLASSDAEGAYNTVGMFSYNGAVSSKLTTTVKPTFTMTLSFKAKNM